MFVNNNPGRMVVFNTTSAQERVGEKWPSSGVSPWQWHWKVGRMGHRGYSLLADSWSCGYLTRLRIKRGKCIKQDFTFSETVELQKMTLFYCQYFQSVARFASFLLITVF